MTIGKLKAKFIEKFGKSEVNSYLSTSRENLIGEHTDYNGGFVLPRTLSLKTN